MAVTSVAVSPVAPLPTWTHRPDSFIQGLVDTAYIETYTPLPRDPIRLEITDPDGVYM